jgi:hypothetical protein
MKIIRFKKKEHTKKPIKHSAIPLPLPPPLLLAPLSLWLHPAPSYDSISTFDSVYSTVALIQLPRSRPASYCSPILTYPYAPVSLLHTSFTMPTPTYLLLQRAPLHSFLLSMAPRLWLSATSSVLLISFLSLDTKEELHYPPNPPFVPTLPSTSSCRHLSHFVWELSRRYLSSCDCEPG